MGDVKSVRDIGVGSYQVVVCTCDQLRDSDFKRLSHLAYPARDSENLEIGRAHV